jgi:hypothetical protein
VWKPGEHHGIATFIRFLAGTELLAALALASGMCDAAACTVLLAVDAIAAAVALLHGEAPLRFFYYAATAIVIVQASKRRAAPV